MAGKLDAPLSGQVLDLTIVADQFFVTSRHIVAKVEPVPDTLSDIAPDLAFKTSGMWTVVAFAFLGGLILNLMPCVLPVWRSD